MLLHFRDCFEKVIPNLLICGIEIRLSKTHSECPESPKYEGKCVIHLGRDIFLGALTTFQQSGRFLKQFEESLTLLMLTQMCDNQGYGWLVYYFPRTKPLALQAGSAVLNYTI